MTILLAIDPGSELSAFVFYNTETRMPIRWAKLENESVLREVGLSKADRLAVEKVESYGMSVGADVFTTVEWGGRFIERWVCSGFIGRSFERVPRRAVKLHLCGSMKAKDPNIRQALIDRYGPGKEKAIGKKASPGPLYGMSGDCWSALAVAITAAETAPELARAA